MALQIRRRGPVGRGTQRGPPEDYELLGLRQSPPPTAAEVASAFRQQAMRWHPDMASSDAPNQAACTARFQKIVDAHARLRRKHGVRL